MLDSLPPLLSAEKTNFKCYEISEADFQQLLKNNIIEPVPPKAMYFLDLRLFTTPEKNETRRRLITHTPASNEALEQVFRTIAESELHELPTQQECVGDCLLRFSAQMDLAWCYGGFELEETRRFWAFRHHDGNLYRLTTIPTGASWCCLLAHVFTDAVADFAATFFRVTHRAYIDNVRFCSDDADAVAAATRCFYRLTKLFRADVNEPIGDALAQHSINTFLGVIYNHAEGYVRFSGKLVGKLQTIASFTHADFARMTVRQLVSVWGTLTHASQISENCRAKYYHFVKFLRRRAHERRPMDEHADYWNCLGDLPARWARDELAIQRRDPQRHNRHDSTLTVFTDASTSGFGITIFADDGKQTIIASNWDADIVAQNVHINELEARAVLHALDYIAANPWKRRVEEQGAQQIIDLMVDNTSVLHCARKGSSRSFWLNAVIAQIRSHRLWSCVRSVRYVRSAENNADWLSRFFPHDGNHLLLATGFARTEKAWRESLLERKIGQ
jgi:hypothetical protein